MPSARRSSSVGCCTRCSFCIAIWLVKLSCVIIGALLTFLFIWLIARPSAVMFHVSDASLTEFNYTNNNTLHYDLALNITIRNSNKKLGIYYDYIEAQTLFHDARFDLETLEPFYQGHKNTTVLSHVFKGQQLLAFSADQVSELDKEKSKGGYDIQLKLYLKTRFKLGGQKLKNEKNTVTCNLHVPLTYSSNNGTSSAGAFQTTTCKNDLFINVS